MATDGLQIYGNIFNPLEPTTQVGPAPTAVEGEEEVPTEEVAQEPEMMSGGGMVSPESARYFGPEGRCMNCVHFSEPGSCEIVSGEIAPEGVCSLFTQDSEEDEMGQDLPVEQGM